MQKLSSFRKMITLEDIREARQRIKDFAIVTALKPTQTLHEATGKNVWLKLENVQPAGSFKLRGAANALLGLSNAKTMHGVVTMSTGNHGRAVSYVAGKLGIRAVICVSELVPQIKIDNMKKLGAEVVVAGKDQEGATAKARQLEKEEGLHYVSAFDDKDVIAGQGTIALEILEQQSQIDTIVAPLSGGGLLSGIAIAAKALKPDITLIGVSMDQGAAMHESIQAGEIVDVVEKPSLADAITGLLPKDNQFTFDICRSLLDSTHLLSENAIAKAMVYALKQERLVLEGAAVTPVALLLEKADEISGKNVALVCSGENVDVSMLLEMAGKFDWHPE